MAYKDGEVNEDRRKFKRRMNMLSLHTSGHGTKGKRKEKTWCIFGLSIDFTAQDDF